MLRYNGVTFCFHELCRSHTKKKYFVKILRQEKGRGAKRITHALISKKENKHKHAKIQLNNQQTCKIVKQMPVLN